MNNNMKEYGKGINYLEALQLIFIVLKMIKVIDWTWWWVLSPTWISIAVIIVVFISIVIVTIIRTLNKRG